MWYLALSALIILCMYVIISLIGTADTIILGAKKLAESNYLEDGEFSLFVPLSDKETEELTDQEITLEEQFYLDYAMEDGSTIRVFQNRKKNFGHKTKNYSDKLRVDEDKCIGCGKCEKLCPMNNIKIVDKKVVQNNQCTMCYRCINNCPKQAMTLLGKKVVGQSVIEKYLLCFQVYNGK